MKQREILSYFNLEFQPFNKEIETSELMNLPTIEKAAEEMMNKGFIP